MNFKLKKSDLNFKVYTVEARPTAPGAENDIAIMSSVPMSNWLMSPEKPSGTPRNDGDVWIQYSTKGSIFNALKQNSLMIATIKAWQFVEGAWVDREAVSWQGDEWSDILQYDWSAEELSELWTTGSDGLTVVREANGLRITRNGTFGVCNSDIPLSIGNFNAVYLKFSECTSTEANVKVQSVQFVAHDVKYDGSVTALVYANSSAGAASGTLRLDLSGLKSYKKLYLGFAITGHTKGKALVESIWFE